MNMIFKNKLDFINIHSSQGGFVVLHGTQMLGCPVQALEPFCGCFKVSHSHQGEYWIGISFPSMPNVSVKDKDSPITGHEGPWGIWIQGSTFVAMSLGRVQDGFPCAATFTPREVPVLILQEAEWIPRPVWTWSVEKSPPLCSLGSNPGRPACRQAHCCLR